MYLQYFVGDRPHRWIEWLPWAEYCYNTSFHSALQDTPFRVLCGRDPPKLLSYMAGSTRVETLDQALLDHDQVLQAATQCLKKAQTRMKEYYDKAYRDVTYTPGDYLQLPLDSQLHNVFHVSLLKPFKGPTPPPPRFLPQVREGIVILSPTTALQARQRHNKWEVLIQWADTDSAAGTREDMETFRQGYPTFEL
ncbi:uncharacterized protein [Aristolochia californica]|uniref:uncharacterized protein n=1 Tax=Aristolochia californica TaxID=171875 RepID=UPI0035D9148C